MDRYDIEYGIPSDVEMYSEIDIKKLKQSVEMELQDEDLQAFDLLAESKGLKSLLGLSMMAAR